MNDLLMGLGVASVTRRQVKWTPVRRLLQALVLVLGSPGLLACDAARLDESMGLCFRPLLSTWELRRLRYEPVEAGHRMRGLASYYSSFFDGRRTANGETFRNRRYTAAHLTLPFGTWVEVRSRATGRTLRLRVNDRGPYARKFVIDLSRAAARALGVDVAPDRYVEIRIIALPGEEPLDVTRESSGRTSSPGQASSRQ